MKKYFNIFIVVLCCLFFLKTRAQNPEAYNQLYTKIYLEVAPKNMQLALQMADSLFLISTTPLFQTKSLMLSASLYQQQEKITYAAELAEKAYTIISKIQDYNWMVRISGFLATQYRMLQLYGKSRMYCDRAIAMIQKIDNPEMVKSTMGFINQELAYNDIAIRAYHSSIRHIRESQKNFDHISQNKDYLTANNEQLLGLNYFYLADLTQSMFHYQNSLILMSRMPDNTIKGLCYKGIADVLIQEGHLNKAKLYLDSAGKVAGESGHLSLKNEIYKTLQKYYLKVKDINNFEKVRRKQDSLRDVINLSRAQFLDSTFIGLEHKNQQAQHIIRARNIPIAVGSCIIALGVCLFFYYRKSQKRRFTRFMADLEIRRNNGLISIPATDQEKRLPMDQNPEDNMEAKSQPTVTKRPESHPVMPEETLQRLLTSLEQFEEQHLYTSTNISLSFLSTHLHTNSKYLSYLLKQYKQKDFNSYINDLRISYIIKQLKEDAEWRKYKISILAEKAGFSSHSKFTSIFKIHTGLSPSVFIQYLGEEETDGIK